MRVFSPHAKLVLDEDAKLKGKLVKLNCTDEPEPSTDGATTSATQPFKLMLSDAEFGVWANKRYELRVDGLTLEGTTDAGGLVNKTIPKDATSVTLVVWFGEYPTGPTKTRTVSLGALAPTSSPKGAAVRLAHLGYFQGEPTDKLDEALAAALKDFQDPRRPARHGGARRSDRHQVFDATHGK